MGVFNDSKMIENDETGGQSLSKLVDIGVKDDHSKNLNLHNN